MLVYYAHSQLKYKTEKENEEIDLIYNHIPIGSHVINPNGWIYENGNEFFIMQQCLKIIDNCDIVMFSTIRGVIGLGVYTEIEHALSNNKSVFMITLDGEDIESFTKEDFENIKIIISKTANFREYAKIN